MKKTKLLLAFFSLLLLFTTYSCQIEELDATPTAVTSSGTTKKINPLFLTHQFSDKKIKPLWKSAIAFENVDAVEVNFSIDKKYYRPLSENKRVVGRQRILLTFDKEGKVKETIIEYIPSNDFTGDIRKINSGNFKNDFKGKVTLTSLGKESKTAWTVSNNKIIQKASVTKTNPLGSNTSKTSGEVCTSVYKCTDYQLSFDDCPPSEACVVDAQNECWWEFVCYDDPYLDTNPEGPAEVDPYDCSVDGRWPWCHTNDDPGSDNWTSSDYATIINLLNGRVKCIYEQLLNSSNSFKNGIQKFDGEFPVSHLKLSINNNLPSNVYGETLPPVNYVTEIQFNDSSFGNLSDLGKATSFAHEIIHAEIFRKMLSAAQQGNLDPSTMTPEQQVNYVNSLKDNFPGLYDYYNERYHSTWNHNMMASHYRSSIADIIEQFDNNRLSRSTYEAIAWLGLGKLERDKSTTAWDNLSAEEKTRITNLINQHFYNGPSNCN